MIYWPDYKGGSIVNLMSSIASACGEKTSYPNLKHLPKEELRNYKNIVLIIIDALGWDYLQNKKDSFLYKNIRNKITSVALPTTACAITTFLTGYPPQQTAVTGWHINIKELGGVTTILPFVPRAKGSFDEKKIKIREILDKNGIFKNIKRKCFIVSPKEINHCQYNLYHTRGAKVIDTKNINSFFSKI